jgi:hypothetical protein
MRRREREREPFWLGYAAPPKLWRSAYVIGLAIGIAGAELGGPPWLFPCNGIWRCRPGRYLVAMHSSPSADAKWSWLSRALYTRSRSD